MPKLRNSSYEASAVEAIETLARSFRKNRDLAMSAAHDAFVEDLNP